jgi:hypothetical protein
LKNDALFLAKLIVPQKRDVKQVKKPIVILQACQKKAPEILDDPGESIKHWKLPTILQTAIA